MVIAFSSSIEEKKIIEHYVSQVVGEELDGIVFLLPPTLKSDWGKIPREGIKVAIICSLHPFFRSYKVFIKLLGAFLENGGAVHFISEQMMLEGNEKLGSSVQKLEELRFRMHSDAIKSALYERQSRGVVLGRPKRNILNNPVLENRGDEIPEYLRSRISISGISRILNVHRHTLKKYIDERWGSRDGVENGLDGSLV